MTTQNNASLGSIVKTDLYVIVKDEVKIINIESEFYIRLDIFDIFLNILFFLLFMYIEKRIRLLIISQYFFF